MSISFNLIEKTFGESGPVSAHGMLIRDQNGFRVVQKGAPEFKSNKVYLASILSSLYHEVVTGNMTNANYSRSLQICNYFIAHNKPYPWLPVQAIVDLFSRVRNYFEGIGFKSTRQIACEIRQKIVDKNIEIAEGFIEEDFDLSLSKFQDYRSDPSFKTDADCLWIRQRFKAFCKTVAAKGTIDYTKPPENPTISPIIHFIWIGSSVPDKINEVVNTWRKFHPGWEIKIWGDGDINSFNWTNRQAFDQAVEAKCWAEAADVWRYDILYNQGGIYADTDVVCLKSFNDLISNNVTFFAGQETNQVYKYNGYGQPLYVCNAVIGSAKGSPIMKLCQQKLRSRAQSAHPRQPRKDILSRTGPILLSKVCRQAIKGEHKDGILILPCSYLYPLPCFFDQRHKKMSQEEIIRKYKDPESLCVHLWEGSWSGHLRNFIKNLIGL